VRRKGRQLLSFSLSRTSLCRKQMVGGGDRADGVSEASTDRDSCFGRWLFGRGLEP
jgi:hypothetical protein